MSLRLADSVRFRRVLDEGVMLRLDTGEILGLNGVGARVIELVSAGPVDRHRVAEALRGELETPVEAKVESDVDQFVDELLRIGAVVEDATDATADEAP